jgi:hypothetical protein
MSGAGTIEEETGPYSGHEIANLVLQTIPENLKITVSAPVGAASIPVDSGIQPSGNLELTSALAAFSRALYKINSNGSYPNIEEMKYRQNEMREARNEVQGALFQLSDNRCNAFELRLRQLSSSWTFSLGSLATVVGGAGAIVSGDAARALSGASGALSGVNAEYQKDIMSSLTSSVIIPGIAKQRAGVRQEIANRRCMGIVSYPLSIAIADAIRYHSACSTDVGVAAAANSISQIHTQSLADVQQAVLAVQALSNTLNGSAGGKSASTAGTPKNASGSAQATPPTDGRTTSTGATSTTAPSSGSTAATGGTTITPPSGGSTVATAGTTAPTSPTAKELPQSGGATFAGSGISGQNNGSQNTPLIGDAVDLPECRSLDEDGLLPSVTTVTAKIGTSASKATNTATAPTLSNTTLGKSSQTVMY